MSLEAKISRIIDEYNGAWDLTEDGTVHQLQPIWMWRPEPENWSSNKENVYPQALRIQQLIEEADLNECLTSPIPYVREYKRWLEAQTK